MTDLPEDEDSPDLTDAQIAMAVVTENSPDMILKMAAAIQGLNLKRLPTHHLRRRKPHLYSITVIELSDGTTKLLVFRADWLKPGV